MDRLKLDFPVPGGPYQCSPRILVSVEISSGNDQVISLPFIGSGPNKLFIGLTKVAVLPASALVIGFLVTLRAWWCTMRQRKWVNRVEFESWWLVKAMRWDLYRDGSANTIAKDFMESCKGYAAAYREVRTGDEGGQMILLSVGESGVPARSPLLLNTEINEWVK
jgi:hypothetical protein